MLLHHSSLCTDPVTCAAASSFGACIFGCKIMNCYYLCYRTNTTDNNCSKTPTLSCTKASSRTGTSLLSITWCWLLVNTAKITISHYLSMWTFTPWTICHQIIWITNWRKEKLILDSLRTYGFISCLIPSSPWSKTSEILSEWSYLHRFRKPIRW